MRVAWKRVARLITSNAMHRKGFRLQDVTLDFVLDQATEELSELKDAPDDPVEMADLFGILIHYCVKQGWTPELIQSLMLEKFNSRFTVEKSVEG